MFDKLSKHFLKIKVNIKSEQKLEEYINFCLDNKSEKIKYETAQHHIIPKSIDSDISNLRKNKWNGVCLTHKDHYMAHYLLTQAIVSNSMVSAFCAMNNRDIKNGRLREEDLVGAEEFNDLKIINHKHLGDLSSKRWLKFHPFSIENSTKEQRNKRAAKMTISRKEIKESGYSSFQEGAIKGGKTRIINGTGTESSKKAARTLRENIDENGLNGLERKSIKSANTKRGQKLIERICPYCNKKGRGGNMKRYHFENCKLIK